MIDISTGRKTTWFKLIFTPIGYLIAFVFQVFLVSLIIQFLLNNI